MYVCVTKFIQLYEFKILYYIAPRSCISFINSEKSSGCFDVASLFFVFFFFFFCSAAAAAALRRIRSVVGTNPLNVGAGFVVVVIRGAIAVVGLRGGGGGTIDVVGLRGGGGGTIDDVGLRGGGGGTVDVVDRRGGGGGTPGLT